VHLHASNLSALRPYFIDLRRDENDFKPLRLKLVKEPSGYAKPLRAREYRTGRYGLNQFFFESSH
jgi:hypothetical protein